MKKTILIVILACCISNKSYSQNINVDMFDIIGNEFIRERDSIIMMDYITTSYTEDSLTGQVYMDMFWETPTDSLKYLADKRLKEKITIVDTMGFFVGCNLIQSNTKKRYRFLDVTNNNYKTKGCYYRLESIDIVEGGKLHLVFSSHVSKFGVCFYIQFKENCPVLLSGYRCAL